MFSNVSSHGRVPVASVQVALKVLEACDEEMLQLRRSEFEVLKTAPWALRWRNARETLEEISPGKVG